MALPQPDPFVPSTKAVQVKIARLGETERFRRLDRLESYYRCTQHQYKQWTWDGTKAPADDTNPGADFDIMPGFYVPLKNRRPSIPYRLAKVIVDRFTGLLFGQGRWPTLRIDGDEVAEDFARTAIDAASMRTAMIQARTLGGATGSVGISYKWFNGAPRFEVHNPKHIHVIEWADREALIPKLVVKAYKYKVDEYDEDAKKPKPVWYHYYREWTEEADIRFKPVLAETTSEPNWEVQEEVQHNLGFCPFVWIQNLPSEDVDGEADYSGLLTEFDQVDILLSALGGGTIANVDPTLVLAVDPALLAEGKVKKGSDNAIQVGVGGAANYLEMTGTSITVGLSLLEATRKYILEVAQCVLADPDKISGAAQSAKAIEYLYAPMLAKADVLREQYGEGTKRAIDGLRAAAAGAKKSNQVFVLPPKKIEVIDPVTNVAKVSFQPRTEPGGDNPVELEWGPYFELTTTDKQQQVVLAQQAAGGKQIISQETATRSVAQVFGVTDIDAEIERIDRDEEQAASMQQRQTEALFPASPLPMPGEEPELDFGDERAPPQPPVPRPEGSEPVE